MAFVFPFHIWDVILPSVAILAQGFVLKPPLAPKRVFVRLCHHLSGTTRPTGPTVTFSSSWTTVQSTGFLLESQLHNPGSLPFVLRTLLIFWFCGDLTPDYKALRQASAVGSYTDLQLLRWAFTPVRILFEPVFLH